MLKIQGLAHLKVTRRKASKEEDFLSAALRKTTRSFAVLAGGDPPVWSSFFLKAVQKEGWVDT